MTLHFLCLNKQWQIRMSLQKDKCSHFHQRKTLRRRGKRQDSNKNTKNTHSFHNTQFNSANSSCSDAKRSAELQKAQPGNKGEMCNCIDCLICYTVYFNYCTHSTQRRDSVQSQIVQQEQMLTYVQKMFSTTAANYLQQAESADLALTSRIRFNFLFSTESAASWFCFFQFLFSAFSCSSRCASALFFDLCISWRRSFINVKETISKSGDNLKQNLQSNTNKLFFIFSLMH